MAEQHRGVGGAEFGGGVPLVDLADQLGVYRGQAAQLAVHVAEQGEQVVARVAGYRRAQECVDRGAERRREGFAVLTHNLNLVHVF